MALPVSSEFKRTSDSLSTFQKGLSSSQCRHQWFFICYWVLDYTVFVLVVVCLVFFLFFFFVEFDVNIFFLVLTVQKLFSSHHSKSLGAFQQFSQRDLWEQFNSSETQTLSVHIACFPAQLWPGPTSVLPTNSHEPAQVGDSFQQAVWRQLPSLEAQHGYVWAVLLVSEPKKRS